METYERFLKYVRVHTASDDHSETTPTTARQFDLAKLLVEELTALGLESVSCDEHAYVYAFLPATPGYEQKPCVAFNAHLDTIPDFSGENVQPRLVPDYDGGDVVLGNSGRVLSPEQFPHLKKLIGQTLIVTDGTTVLGADDKAGIAVAISACERVMQEKIPHGRVALCFSPDEEVGHGAALLDLEKLGAAFAYTIDGDEPNEINAETFNASAAHIVVNGVNVHPGSAKDTMVNAALVAMEINAMLPAGDIPSRTEDHEGFFHLCYIQGGVERTEMDYIVRDHSASVFAAREQTLRHIEKLINEKYGAGTMELSLRESYRNMAEKLEERPEVLEIAREAIRRAGMIPEERPIRGGTDGAQLSFRGLPTPNLGTGGYAFHGPYEHTSVENLNKATEVAVNVIRITAE